MSGLVTPAYAIGADEHTADVFRMALQGLLAGTGVVGANDFLTDHVAGALEMEIKPGALFLPGTLGTSAAPVRVNAGSQHANFSSLPEDFTTQGAYHTWLRETSSFSVSTPSASHERIDLVVAYVEDAEWSGSLNQAVLAIVTGTPEASPKPPAPPANSVVICKYKVPVGATEILNANITDQRPVAAALLPAEALRVGSATKYAAQVSRALNTAFTPTENVFVLIESSTGGEATLYIGGQELNGIALTKNGIFSFICPAGTSWELRKVAGTPEIFSSYLSLL